MTRTMKRAVSILLTLAMVVTSLSYTPKTVEAAENYSNLNFTEVTSGDYTFGYYIVQNELDAKVEFLDNGITLQIGYSSDYLIADTTVTVNDVTTESGISPVTMIDNGLTKLNPSAFDDNAYTKISVSNSSTGVEKVTTVIVKRGNPEGTTPAPTTATETESGTEEITWTLITTSNLSQWDDTFYYDTNTAVKVGTIQNPGWADAPGIYMTVTHVPSSVKINGEEADDTQYVTDGTGVIVYASCLTKKINTIEIENGTSTDTIIIKNVKAQSAEPTTEEGSTTDSQIEEAPDYSGITVADDGWTKIINGTAADGNNWYYATTYFSEFTYSTYNQLANSGSVLTYGNTDNGITDPVFAISVKNNDSIASVWVNDTKLEEGDIYHKDADVICFAQSLFATNDITYISVRYNDGTELIVPIKVVAETSTTEEVTTTSGEVTVPDDAEWIKLNDASGISNTDDFYYYIPTGNTIGFMSDNSTELDNTVLIVFTTGLETATFNGNSASFDGSGVTIDKSDIAETGKVYALNVTGNSGTTATVYIKKQAAPAYAPTGLTASVKDGSATILWYESADAAGFTYEVTVDGESAMVVGTTATFDMGERAYGTYDVVLTTYNAEGEAVDTQTYILNYKDPEAVDSDFTVDAQWEKDRAETLSWTSVDSATGYAIYVEGKLYKVNTVDELTAVIPAYALAHTPEGETQATTVGKHEIIVVALFDDEEAPAYEDINQKHVLGSDTAELYVNYIYGNGTDIWNTSGVDSVWNFTVCESNAPTNIETGADLDVTYNSDGSASLVFNNMGVHLDNGQQPWTIKAAIYNQPVTDDGMINLSFDIDGPAALAGQKITINCTPEEWVNGGYGVAYEYAPYTFEPVYGADGTTIVASVLHYSNSFTSTNSTYDLLFGLGELKFGDDEATLTLSDPQEVKVYGLKTLTATGIANVEDSINSSIYVSWTTDVPVRLESEYTYQVSIDGKVVDEDATSGTTYEGYNVGNHEVKVVSIYNGANTSELTTTATIEDVTNPDLVITDISVPTQEWFVGDTVPITITMKNIGNADAVLENAGGASNNITVSLYVNGVGAGYFTLDTGEESGFQTQTLAAGASVSKTIDYEIVENLVGDVHNSSYVIKAVADSDGKINESNENNNEYERTFTFNERLNDLTLENNGTNVYAAWEPEEGAVGYALQYILNGQEEIVYINADTTTYIFPEGDEPDNQSEVNVYAQQSDGSWHQIAEGQALADLIIERLTLENGVAYVGEDNYIIAVVKNIGTAKAIAREGQLQVTAVTFTDTDVYTGYGTKDNEVLDPNKTFTITVDNGPYNPTEAGTVTLNAIADDISRIPESTRDNNTASIDVTAIKRGTLTLTNNDGKVTATWTDPNVNGTENPLTVEAYQLTYISNGTTVTKTATENSFEFEEAIDNNTTVEISVKYKGIDGYHKLAEDTALADLIIETITVPDNTYLNEAFNIVVTIKNQGTAQVPASSEEFVEGYGGWIVVAMQQNENYNNGNLMLGYTAGGLLAGASANVTIEGVTGTVLSDAITGDTLTFAVDSPWGIDNSTSYITEKDENNNTGEATIRITERPFEQQRDMDWTPLYAEGDKANKEKVLFKVMNGTQEGYVEYKVLDTSYTDINYADIFTDYHGYNLSEDKTGYTWMFMGIDNGHNVFAYDEATNKSTTSVNFSQVTSGFCNNYQPGDMAGMANILAPQNWDIVDAYDNPVADKKDSPLVYVGNGFNFLLNSFALGKYYVMNIVDSATDEYVTVAFRVTGETGSWIQAKSTNGPDDQIPIPYHEENMAYTVNGKFYYDGSDLKLAAITVYNGDHLTLATDTSMPIDVDNYKIEMAYASVDENGDFVSPTDGFVTVTDGLGTEDEYRIQIKLPELIKDLPVHSAKGGLTDDEYYLMKVYPDADDLTEYIAIPIMIRAEIPMIEAVPSINAAINSDDNDSSVLSISWTETINQAAYDYHYDLEVYASEEAYNNGESALITETDAAPGAAYTYNTADYNLGTSVYVRVIANWCEQSIATAATAVEEYNPGWREISGDSQIDVHAGQSEKVSVLGTVSFYDDVKVNHAYDVVGYNGMYINVAGNTSYYGPDEENSIPTPGTESTVYISKGVKTVAELAAMTDDDYSEANTYEQTAGQIKINTQNEFEVSYSTTYYNVKVVKGDKTTIIKMKIEVTPGDVEVNAFQMNTDTSEGGVSEFNPSFRIVSRASKVVAVGEPFDITDENGETVTNVAIGSVKSYGTIYTTNADATVDTMKFGDEYIAKGEIVEGIYSFEATDMGKFSDDADLNSFYYALTIKGLTYLVDMLDTEYTVRAYAVIEGNNIVYGDKVETTSIYDIAKVLYDDSRMSTEANHNYLYDNVLNIVAIKNNWLNIGYAMLKALNVTTKNDDYALINNAYKDLYYYINLARDYRVDKYYERGAFVCKTPTNGYDTEATLLARLNTVTTDDKQYDSVAEWIENEAAAQGYEGFYKRVVYNPLQTANNVATGDGTE